MKQEHETFRKCPDKAIISYRMPVTTSHYLGANILTNEAFKSFIFYYFAPYLEQGAPCGAYKAKLVWYT